MGNWFLPDKNGELVPTREWGTGSSQIRMGNWFLPDKNGELVPGKIRMGNWFQDKNGELVPVCLQGN